MSDENDLLDEDYNIKKGVAQEKKFNYTKYSFSYIFLMITIGALVTKIMRSVDLKFWQLLMGSLAFISFGMIMSLIFEGGKFVYGKLISQKPLKKDVHPIWFRILETCFYTWCVIIFVMYFRNKVF